jgi:hypothetical protein
VIRLPTLEHSQCRLRWKWDILHVTHWLVWMKTILLPLVIDPQWTSMSIKTVEGKLLPLEFSRGLTIQNRRLCIEAILLHTKEKQHRVRLPDGQICWVQETPIEVNSEAA